MSYSQEERKKAVEEILFGKPLLLIAKPLRGIENRIIENCCTGYNVLLNNLSYRGVWVSTIEKAALCVDGKEVPAEQICFCLNGKSYPVTALQGHTEIFWGIEDAAMLRVNQPGGLSSGAHEVEVAIWKRQDFGHSYGEGKDGYENATEFTVPDVIKDSGSFELEVAS